MPLSMEEGPDVTGKTGGEEACGARTCVTFHSSSWGFSLLKVPARPGSSPGAGRNGGLKPGGTCASLDRSQGPSVILPPQLSLAGD